MRRQGSGPAPASFPQQRLWVLQQLESECSLAYEVRLTMTSPAAPEQMTLFQQRVAAIFRELLNVERVGLHDDFFNLGGHSLLATQVISRVRSTFGVELPLRALFSAPTVARLTAQVEAQLLVRTQESATPPLRSVPRDGDLPLSFAQQRLWVVDQVRPGGSDYNIVVALRLEGTLDTEALRRALEHLVARHEALRTTFVMKARQPFQILHPPTAWVLPLTDLGDMEPGARQAEARKLAAEEARKPFDLSTGPLLRTRLLRLDPGQHLLVLVMHHIVSDGWSMAVMVREVAAAYEAFSTGRTPMLPALPVQYADFAAWQHGWLQGDVLAREVAWWKEQLAGAPQVLELPTDKPRPSLRSERGAALPLHLPRELSERLLALARSEGTTLFMALLAAWQVVLSRYSRQEELLIGSPIAGRRQGELEGLVGFFVNTLVLRGRVRARDSFRALLRQARETTLAAYEHQDIPFEKLVEELQPQRDLSRNPLVQVIFSLQNMPTGELKAPGLTLRPVEVDTATARFDLNLTLSEAPDGLRGGLEYSTDLFEARTAARMAGHLQTLLEAAVATPDRPLGTLELLTPAERRQVLTEWNATGFDYPREAYIHHLFERQAALRPDAIAVEFGEQRLTYAQLEARANQLAHLLRSRGVSTDSLVAVGLERSLELVVALLAILKAGGAYVPLDASYPAQRLAMMLEDAPPRLLVTSRALRSRLPVAESVPCLFMEELPLEGQPTSSIGVAVGPRNLAYVDFTSGSTGRPKGVAVEHRGVLRLLHGVDYIHLGPQETFLLVSPISFDASTLELWGALMFGGRLVVFPPQPPTDMELLGRVLKRHGVTTLYLSAGLFAQVVDVKLEVLSGLKQVLVGGDILSPVHTRRVLETLGVPVTNGYGPTESTVFTCCFRLERPEEVGSTLPIGAPIANTQVYVLDAEMRPVPVGVPGELYIGGEGLARGYLSRPDLTAERFIPHPFSAIPGERLYRTGDLARWRADGKVDFLGRIDTQVKVRGFRIELAEVEAALRTYPATKDAVVVVREDVPGDKRLVAYAVLAQPVDGAALREHLRQRLPEYMVPSAFVVLPALPLNPNGKVDRKALPAPDAASTGRQGRFVEPSNPLEQQLAALYARELGTDRVGVNDHLFDDLGGTSLSVVRIAARLREELKREVPVVWLFEHPTVHGLAQRLDREAGVTAVETRQEPASGPRPRTGGGTASSTGAIAIIGMAGQFPGAASVQEFWRNLREGVESISRFTPEELEHMPGLPEGLELWQHPAFVPAAGVLEGIDEFDHAFFDMSLREAQWLDPQQRLFLQTAWTVLEDAGIAPARYPGTISLYAGATNSGYTETVKQTLPLDGAAHFELYGTATHESLATKTAFKLGLTGESTLVYTACSTGLVAVHLACQNLLAGLSDVALAGAARITVPQRTGYVWQEGMILSPDGHCRAFDAQARGTVPGNGVAAVVLKRLEDAQRDGDSIYAVIRGTATNNDGRRKSGFTAPSVQGQATVITQALSRAGVEPKDIGYVETHGTATPLGDPIEVAALQRAYGLGPEHRGTISLASLKTNMGHLDTVAGLAGLMKAALALHHGEIPPSLHFERPNPQIDFDSGPFFVNTTLRPWPKGETPRRAAVSSFGVGGTNAHAVLEESPMSSQSGSTRRSHQLVLLSARSPEALEAASQRLATHVEGPGAALPLADVAFTYAVGRMDFEHRRAVVARDMAELARQLRKPYTPVKVKDLEAARRRRVAFVFPGQGAQQVGMGRELYEAEPAFRAHVDACLALLEESLRAQVSALLHAEPGTKDARTAELLADTRVALPTLFTVEYALARTWMDWGVKPYAVLGHSFGEYAAACVAGVLPLEDGLKLAVVRGELMHRMPPGAMLAVALSEAQVRPLLSGRLELAALNAPDRCVVAGPVDEVERLREELKRREVGAVRMPAPHAFHSADVEPLMPELARTVASLRRSEPVVRYASSVTGTWATPGALAEPRYWTDQMRQPVRFSEAVGALLEEGCGVLLEVGPGQDLTPLVRSCLGQDRERVSALASLRRGGASTEYAGLMQALGELWAMGLELDWEAFYAQEQRRRLHLPTYAFQKKRCWVEPRATTPARPVLPAAASVPAVLPASAPAPAALTTPVPEPTPVPAPVMVPVAAPASSGPVREDAPRGSTEERVAALWRERLGLDFVGRDDNFLEIGGNSLMAAQLLNQLRDTFGVQLPLAALFEAPTVAGIAERLEPLLQQAPAAQQSRELPLAPQPRTRELALSFVQERVWRLEQYLPGLSAYTIPVVLRLEGFAEVAPLERALQEILRRHEALRTTYDVVDGRPVQRFHPHVHVPLVKVELTGTSEEREAEAMRLAREDAARPFDLVNGPVVRTTLLKLRPDLHILLLAVHHVVFDTLSALIFVQELGQLYGAFRQGQPSPLPPLPLQYADFGEWQRRTIAERLLPEQEQWWRQRLAGMPRRLDVPTDRPRPAACPLTSERMVVDFSPALAREMVAFGKRENFTPYMTVLAAWQALLHRYTGQTDIIVGTPIANRTRPELLPLIGYVAHSAAFRTSFADDPTFRELIGRVKQEVSEVQSRPDVPFEYLVEQLVPGKDIGRDRMTDTVFVYHSNNGGGGEASVDMTGVRASLMQVPGTPVQWGTTLSDLTLILTEEPGRVHGALEYATELFDEATARRMLEHLQALLAAALAAPDERVSRLPLVTDVERRAWPLPRPTPASEPLLARLAGRARRTPDAVAITQGERSWTWAELSARAGAVAARLRTLGVRAGEPVAVCLRPSPEKLAALWGVLDAGGAAVALGPSDLGTLGTYAPEGAVTPPLVTWRGAVTPMKLEASRVLYVEDALEPSGASSSLAPAAPGPDTVAWLLPTGAGKPAWSFSHQALAELFTALDGRLRPSEGGTWLVAVEASAERPELESLWALSRGLRVVFPSEQMTAQLVRLGGGGPRTRAMDLSLSYFANDEDSMKGPKYELLLEGSKFADAHGFSAVWTPERHFHSFGGIYPQPGVISAALAAVTRNVRLRSGSVVLPLHDPMLIAEQWSVVDNLSNGRVDLSIATGWHVQDFIFNPSAYEDRRNILLRNLATLRALWRGEKIQRQGGGGVTVEVGLRPKPVQKELPIWLTATGNPETFRLAGELGAGILTGLFAHSLEELKPKVALYRETWRRNGHPGRGHITCMLHTFIGDDEQEVLRTVRKPLLAYFRSSADITASLLAAQGHQGEVAKLSEADINALLEHTFEHHAKGTGLIGTVESGLKRMQEVREADVDEVTCLIDFGVETPVVLESLRKLARIRERMEAEASVRQEQVLVEGSQGVDELLELARRSGAVLLQTSARLARTLAELPKVRESLGTVGALVLEGASTELAASLHRVAGVEVLLAGDAVEGALLPRAPEERVPSGLRAWVLDEAGQPVPANVVGELALEGAGVPGSLWRAAEEERRRLVPHPLGASARLYRTGRAVRMRADGRVESVSLPARAPVAPAPAPRASAQPRPAPRGEAPVPQAIPRAPRNGPLPLSFAQQRLWYLQQLDPASTAYNNVSNFRLNGALDTRALQAAMDALLERHEALRTTYALTENGAVQVIHPPGTLPMPVEEVPGATPEERETAMLRRCRENADQPFDLDKGPVARALLLRMDSEEHVLSLALHHVVSDAWCNFILAQELPVLYACFSAGLPSPLPPLPVQYADYAVWQRQYLEGPVLDAQLGWWKAQLAGVPALELPTDMPRPASQSYAGDGHRFQWPRELSEPLLALGRREGATSFMVLMALYQALLGRYAGQDDFAIGTPIAGRNQPEVQGLIGCFVNTLAFRSRLSGAPSFRELLARVRKQALEAYSRQDAPFERLIDLLGVPRDLSRTPVFQVMLNVLNTPETEAKSPTLRLGSVEVPSGTAKFDLGLDVWERREGLGFRIEYATNLFEKATVERLAGHLAVLARVVVESPDTPLPLLPLLTDAERRQVLVEWNATRVDFPRDVSIHQLFERQATLTPKALAVEFEGQRLTYAQLDARANQLAHHLRSLGVGPESLVGVCLERSLEMVVALFGVLKSGAAYVPMDPAYPRERLAWMLEDTAAPVLLLQERLRDVLPPHSARVLCLDSEWETVARQPSSRPAPLAGPEALAYVIFTSGSTGRPKGAMNAHAGVVNRLLWMQQEYGLTPMDTVLQKTPFSFDVSVWEFFWPLMVGARLVVARPGGHQEPDYLVRVLAEQRVTTVHFVPSMLRAFVEEPGLEGLTHLRRVVCSGEALPADLVRRAYARLPEAEVHNLYGPTEAAVDVTSWACPRGDSRRSLPIGRPVANTRIHLLDRHGQPVPPGVAGELYIGGVQVGRGYWRRPQLTAERFIPDRFSDTPGARLYRTGDLARWLPDGTVEYLGRADFQVKLRGFRIELGEIETALLGWPGVRDAVAVVRQDVTGDQRLVAYVTGEVEALDEAGLRAFLQKQLPEYMVPSAFVRLEVMPLTPSGKVDRKALPTPEAPVAKRGQYVAPSTPTESTLAELFAQVLGVERVGVHDSFFELGGHSLLATQLVVRARAALGVELGLRTVFESPTVAALAARLSTPQQASAVVPPPIEVTPEREDAAAALPLSFAQQRLWFIHQLDPERSTYNIPAALKLEGTLDASALQKAFNELVRRHEALRTTFHDEAGEPFQSVHPPAPLPLKKVDLTRLPDLAQRQAEARRLAVEEARRPFDLAWGPLLRALLLKLGPTEHVLVLNMHHIVSDGWSMGVLVREMAMLYEAFRQGQPSPLPELPLQYVHYATWQRNWLKGEVLEAQLEFWRRQLEGTPPYLELPTDKPRPTQQTFLGATVPVRLPRTLSEAVESLASRQGATPFMVLLAAWQLLLRRYSGQDDISVGSPIAGRRDVKFESLIGFFVNTLVLRARFTPELTFRQLLAQVRDTTLGAYEHQDVPFEKLVEVLQPRRDMGRSPLFQVLFALQNAPVPELSLPGITLRPLEFDSGIVKLDLELSLHRDAEGFAGSLIYDTDLFEESTVARMATHLGVLLEAALATPDAPLSRLPLLTGAERQQVLIAWNNTRADYPSSTVHQLFAEQARRTPDAIAVEFQGRTLSYAQLDSRSNQLARYLLSLGLSPESRVGLCLHRSLEMVVGLVAILKAGACYVPLDPAAPTQRLTFMFEDSDVAAVLTLESVTQTLPPHSRPVVRLDADWERIASLPADAVSVPSSPEHLAYVTYTSGSTGTPKGVAVPHRAVLRLLFGMPSWRLGPDEVVLQLSPLVFDPSVLELWGALLSGARLVVYPPHTPDVEELGRILVERRVSVLSMATALFDQLQQHQPQALAHVCQVQAGGEAMPVARARERLAQGLPLINAYGPTESTTITTLHALQPGDEVGASVPIGRPIHNTQVYVLDEAMQPVPVGVPGELYIGGDGLARGYQGRPALTAKRFVPHPFSTEPGARLYRSGDRVRWRADGSLEFLGRLDFQVKVRGFRIELGEVEAALRSHPSVGEAVAVVREDRPGDKRLVGYVVSLASEGEAVDATVLSAWLRQRLPEYMVPWAIVALEELPLTPAGKVDRQALPAPDAPVSRRGEPVAPRTPTEQTLAKLFSQVLGVERVGVHDSFFELGGHSLLATQLVSRVNAAFHVEIGVRAFFEAPTVAGLAARLDSRQASDRPASEVPSLTRVDRSAPLPLSFSQQRLWVLEELHPGSSAYNMLLSLRLEGTLDIEVLRRCFEEVLRRHESLRTTFQSTGETPIQVISPPSPFTLPVVDLSSEAHPQAEASRLAAEEAGRPFNLSRGPLLRARLLRIDSRSHLLAVAMHHTISDGWSMGVLSREVSELYRAFASGRPSPLPELPIQYADFAVWQRAWLQGEVLSRQLGYWKQQLAAPLPTLELPTDRPRPAMQSFRGAQQAFVLPPALIQELEALGHPHGVTLFMTLLSGFFALLHRYTGQEDFIVGTPIAGRTRPELEGLIGLFINTLALRSRVRPEHSFRELLLSVRETTLQAYAHQDLPFEQLVEELQPQRDLSRSALFQVLFVLQNMPVDRLELPGLVLSHEQVENGTSKFDLSFYLQRTPRGLEGAVEYNTDLFDPATIQRMVGHYHVLLEAVSRAPQQHVGSLPLLTEAERHRLLVEWNDTAVDFPHGALIHSLFRAQVTRTPHAPALACGDSLLTYQQLAERVHSLSWHLRSLGVRADSLVALCVERSVDMVVSMLAILEAGGAYVPLDPTYPRERLASMLDDSDARVLVTQRHLLERLPSRPGRHAVLVDEPSWAQQRLHPPSEAAFPDSVAYVIYTSGSTGRPKGVQVPHRTVLNFFTAMDRALAVPPRPVWLAATSISFDISVLELLWTLTRGFQVVVQVDSRERGWLAEQVRRHSVTHVQFTPSLARGLLLEPDAAFESGSLRQVLVGGEALPAELATQLLRKLGPGELLNMFGPTETTVWSTVQPVRAPGVGTVPIGRPVANTRLYVLDARLHPVPTGVPGELYLGGAGVTRGYLGRPELTAERFLPDGFSPRPGARMYRTGDMVRWSAQGHLEFLGRADHQVKVRGFRIEPGEVESALLRVPGVREAVVVAREDVPGDKRLVGYVVPQPGESLDTTAVRTHLHQQLPEYMVPSALVVLPALPLSPNGKVDRKALPAPQGTSGRKASRPPQGPVEQALARIWSEVLRLEAVGAEDDFFALGGHSLLALKVVSQARREGMELEVHQLFQHPTLAALAAAVAAPASPPRAQAATSPAPEGEEELPFTPPQRWYLETFDVENHAWAQSLAFDVPPDFQPELLRQSLAFLFEHHDVFRLRVFRSESGWAQRMLPTAGEPHLEVLELGALEPQAQRRALLEMGSRHQQLLSIIRGPVLATALCRTGGQGPDKLLITLHHSVYDAYSLAVFFEDLGATYQQLAAGQPPRLLSVPTRYRDYLLAMADHGNSRAMEQARAFWLDEARLRPVPPLPTDLPGGRHTDLNSRRHQVVLPPELMGRIASYLRAHEDVSLNDLLLHALSRAYTRWSGANLLRLDLEHNGRTGMLPGWDLSRMVGPTTVKVPLLLEPSPSEPPAEGLARVKQTVRQTLAHALGYGLLRYGPDAAARERLAVLGSPQVFFNNRGLTLKGAAAAPQGAGRVEALVIPRADGGENVVSYDLMVECDDTEQGPMLTLVYSSKQYRDETLHALASDMLTHLLTLTGEP